MKFIVSSSELLSHLQRISKAISGKATIPILDNFLFNLSNSELTITASDLESTLITKMAPENIEGEGSIALEAKRLLDILKEFPEQPLTFEINEENLTTDIISENGKFSIVGAPADEFPQLAELNQANTIGFTIDAGILEKGIIKTLFATASDELRPVMNGVFFSLTENEKNAIFTLPGYKLICRLTEGNYPNYESVIPTVNPNKLIINRTQFFNAVKRVSVFSNQASNLIKLHLEGNQLTISAQDIDFSISAYERLACQYNGDTMEIGFKSVFLNEILSNISSDEVIFEMSDPSKAGIMLPFEKETEDEDELMLLMPMMINS